MLAAACVLALVAVVVAVIATGGSDQPRATARPSAPAAASDSSAVVALRKADKDRNAREVVELTQLMRDDATQLDPVVRGINQTLPPGTAHKVGKLASAREADDWVRKARSAAATFEDQPSGDTNYNITRRAFAAAVRGIARTAVTYRLAVQDRAVRRRLLSKVRAQRDHAKHAWQIAAAEIDVININAGFGHPHPPEPGGN